MLVYGAMVNKKMVGAISILKTKVPKKGKGKSVVVEGNGKMHYFNLTTILVVTNNFYEDNKLGQGDFGKKAFS